MRSKDRARAVWTAEILAILLAGSLWLTWTGILDSISAFRPGLLKPAVKGEDLDWQPCFDHKDYFCARHE